MVQTRESANRMEARATARLWSAASVDGCRLAEKRVKQCTRWWGRKEDQGAAQAACVVGLLRRGAQKRATACEKRKAAWGQEK